MGSQWDVNRSVAQIHAPLYISEQPLNAEQISETLGIARSNVSNSLKELQTWRVIEREPIPGDRRDHFIAEDASSTGQIWSRQYNRANGFPLIPDLARYGPI